MFWSFFSQVNIFAPQSEPAWSKSSVVPSADVISYQPSSIKCSLFTKNLCDVWFSVFSLTCTFVPFFSESPFISRYKSFSLFFKIIPLFQLTSHVFALLTGVLLFPDWTTFEPFAVSHPPDATVRIRTSFSPTLCIPKRWAKLPFSCHICNCSPSSGVVLSISKDIS